MLLDARIIDAHVSNSRLHSLSETFPARCNPPDQVSEVSIKSLKSDS